MEEHQQNIQMLRHMLSVLMVRQSNVHLTEQEKEQCQQGIKALQAAVEFMDKQVWA